MTTTPTPGGSIFTRCQGVNIQAVLTGGLGGNRTGTFDG